jgi:hypothetical protein
MHFRKDAYLRARPPSVTNGSGHGHRNVRRDIMCQAGQLLPAHVYMSDVQFGDNDGSGEPLVFLSRGKINTTAGHLPQK